MNATKCLEYEESSVLDEVIQARNEKEVVDKHLSHVQSMSETRCKAPVTRAINFTNTF